MKLDDCEKDLCGDNEEDSGLLNGRNTAYANEA